MSCKTEVLSRVTELGALGEFLLHKLRRCDFESVGVCEFCSDSLSGEDVLDTDVEVGTRVRVAPELAAFVARQRPKVNCGSKRYTRNKNNKSKKLDNKKTNKNNNSSVTSVHMDREPYFGNNENSRGVADGLKVVDDGRRGTCSLCSAARSSEIAWFTKISTGQPTQESEKRKVCLSRITCGFPFTGDVVEQVKYVNDLFDAGLQMAAVATSVLLSRVSAQLAVDGNVVKDLVRSALCVKELDDYVGERLDFGVVGAKSDLFVQKGDRIAAIKQNVYFDDVVRSLEKLSPVLYDAWCSVGSRVFELTNDQAACAVIHSYCLYNEIGIDCLPITLSALKDPAGCKSLTTVLKGLGANNSLLGAMLTEMQSMQGRGVGRVDLKQEARKRCVPSARISCPDMFTDAELVSAFKRILSDELDLNAYRPVVDDDDWWSKRWLWCVNGSHNKSIGKSDKTLAFDWKGQVHRRVAAEMWQTDPTRDWDGMTFVSAAEKLEAGKSRLLLACDTRHYFAFQHLMAPVEGAWRNERVLLDPGAGGMSAVCKRVLSLRGDVWAMLDYDDFNSQHTLRCQKLLIKTLCDFVGYDKLRAENLVRSFDRMQVSAGGECVGYMAATLASGSRVTTFVNSMCCAAYIMASAPHLWDRFSSMHTGDDVIAKFSCYSELDEILTTLRKRGCRLNSMKQSVGYNSAEFLRMVITSNGARGYVSRSIASLVVGNWSTEAIGAPRDLLMSFVGTVRSVINRSECVSVGSLLAHSLQKRCGRLLKLNLMERVLTGEVSVCDGPSFACNKAVISSVVVVSKQQEIDTDVVSRAGRTHSTSDYLSKHVSPVERYCLQLVGKSVKTAMVRASYAKSVMAGSTSIRQNIVSKIRRVDKVAIGVVNSRALVGSSTRRGVLSRYPVLVMLKDVLPKRAVVKLLEYLGQPSGGKDWFDHAWGGNESGSIVCGVLPYGDASSLCKVTTCGVIVVDYPVRM